MNGRGRWRDRRLSERTRRNEAAMRTGLEAQLYNTLQYHAHCTLRRSGEEWLPVQANVVGEREKLTCGLLYQYMKSVDPTYVRSCWRPCAKGGWLVWGSQQESGYGSTGTDPGMNSQAMLQAMGLVWFAGVIAHRWRGDWKLEKELAVVTCGQRTSPYSPTRSCPSTGDSECAQCQ